MAHEDAAIRQLAHDRLRIRHRKPNEQEVRGGGQRLNSRDFTEAVGEDLPIGDDAGDGGTVVVAVREGRDRGGAGSRADVAEPWHDSHQIRHQRLRKDAVTNSHSRQAGEFAQRAQNREIRVLVHQVEVAGAGELGVRLVDGYQAGCTGDDSLDSLGRHHIAGRVIRIADQDQLGAVVDRIQDASRIELKVPIQRYVDCLATVATDEQLIDHERWLRDDDAIAVVDEEQHQRLEHVVETGPGDDPVRRYAGIAPDSLAQRPGVEFWIAIVRGYRGQSFQRPGRRPVR